MIGTSILPTPRELQFQFEHDRAAILMGKVPGLGFIQALAHVRSGAPLPICVDATPHR